MLLLFVGFSDLCMVNNQSKRDRGKKWDLGQLCFVLILAVGYDADEAGFLTAKRDVKKCIV